LRRLTSGRALAHNAIWNLVGLGAPMLVAVVTVPLLINGLGPDRFGVLTLAWMTIGYFSLFDLGLGRALTKVVAEKLGAGQEEEIPELFWTSLVLMLALGVVGAIVWAAFTPLLVHRVLKIPAVLEGETLVAFYLLAISLPITITTTGLRGTLEAQQRFGMTSALRVAMGIFMFLAPVAVLSFTPSLAAVVATLLLGRAVAWAVHLLLCLRVMPALRTNKAMRVSSVGPLLRLGGWMTVSNTVSPIMATLDRFFIGALLSVAAVTYYATPFDVVTALLILPSALSGVIFPAFATTFAIDRQRSGEIFDRALKATFAVLFPIVLVVVALARNGLGLWLGADFSRESTHVLQWLAIGVLANGVASVPFALVQGLGRPDLTAKLHLIELPCYLVAVWWLVRVAGIEGAAIAWTVRVAIDLLLLLGLTRRLVPDTAPTLRRAYLLLGAALPALGVAAWPMDVAVKGTLLVAALLIYAPIAWRLILFPKERAQALDIASSILHLRSRRGAHARRVAHCTPDSHLPADAGH